MNDYYFNTLDKLWQLVRTLDDAKRYIDASVVAEGALKLKDLVLDNDFLVNEQCRRQVEEINKLKALVAQYVNKTGGWKPIGTAPKDGRRILIYGNNEGVSWEAIGCWYLCNMAWYDSLLGNKLQGPTHWMPLPEPPQQKP